MKKLMNIDACTNVAFTKSFSQSLKCKGLASVKTCVLLCVPGAVCNWCGTGAAADWTAGVAVVVQTALPAGPPRSAALRRSVMQGSADTNQPDCIDPQPHPHTHSTPFKALLA